MTFGSVFGRTFSPTFQPSSQAAASSASTWWDLNGTITSCVAAYQAKGAASYAASLTDLSGNSNDATEGNAPDWDVTNGWKFVKTNNDYLKTGIIPADNYSVAFRYSDAVNEATFELSSLKNTPNNCYFELNASISANMRFLYGDKAMTISGGYKLNGIMVMTSAAGYYNGEKVGEIPAYTWNGTTYEVIIGGRNTNGNIGNYANVYVQAAAIYSGTLTPTQVGNLTTAMNAL